MKFCDCDSDGWCQRYRRNMVGRLREICAGVNCDLGTSAAFREQWEREAGDVKIWQQPTKLLLKTYQAPGDTVAMTAAVYSLHRAHPGRYLTAIESPHSEVWKHNPDVVPFPLVTSRDGIHCNLCGNFTDSHTEECKSKREGWLEIHMHYPAIHQSNHRAVHFMQGWCEHLGRALGVDVPLMTDRPHLYFDYQPPVPGNYWVVCSGGKHDLTNKLWGHHNYAKVMHLLAGKIMFAQVGGSGDGEYHQTLYAECDLIGKTNLRQLFDVVRGARGVLCGVSLLMHVAAALGKPAVVIAGGREPVAWNAYPRQQYLHTVGALPCYTPQGDSGGACWRSRVVSLGDGTPMDEHTCLRPVNNTPTKLTRCVIPECMTMISPERVVELILAYDRQYNGPKEVYNGCGP